MRSIRIIIKYWCACPIIARLGDMLVKLIIIIPLASEVEGERILSAYLANTGVSVVGTMNAQVILIYSSPVVESFCTPIDGYGSIPNNLVLMGIFLSTKAPSSH